MAPEDENGDVKHLPILGHSSGLRFVSVKPAVVTKTRILRRALLRRSSPRSREGFSRAEMRVRAR